MSQYPFCNKYKVRGWKRQIHKIDVLIKEHQQLSLDRLEQYGYDNLGLWVAPWSNLTKRNPPVWLFRKYLKGLLETYKAWEVQLSKNYSNYYLKIWIFQPRNMLSQVVAAIGDRMDYYNNLFTIAEKQTQPKMFNIDDINNLHWTSFVDREAYCESDFEDDKEHIEYLTKNANSIINKEDDKEFIFDFGCVWVNN